MLTLSSSAAYIINLDHPCVRREHLSRMAYARSIDEIELSDIRDRQKVMLANAVILIQGNEARLIKSRFGHNG